MFLGIVQLKNILENDKMFSEFNELRILIIYCNSIFLLMFPWPKKQRVTQNRLENQNYPAQKRIYVKTRYV